MSESRLVPCNLMSWPVHRDLLPDQNLIVYHMWATSPSACGCYIPDLPGWQGQLGITRDALQQALDEFERRGKILSDPSTGEIFIVDWFRWHKFKTAATRRLLEDAIWKVESDMLRAVILEKSEGCGLTKPQRNRTEGNVSKHNDNNHDNSAAEVAAGGCCGGEDLETVEELPFGDDPKNLIFPEGLHGMEIDSICRELASIAPIVQDSVLQAVLDELAGAMVANKLRVGAVPFIHSLIRAVRENRFTPSMGVRVAAARNTEASMKKQKAATDPGRPSPTDLVLALGVMPAKMRESLRKRMIGHAPPE